MKRIFVLIGVALLVSCSQKAKTNQEVDASVTEQTLSLIEKQLLTFYDYTLINLLLEKTKHFKKAI